MYVQLVSISMLYFIIWIPFVTISLIRLFYDPLFLQDAIMLVINYCLYICPLASPFIALVGLPAVRQRLRTNNWSMLWNNHVIQTRIRPTGTKNTRVEQQRTVPHRQYDEHSF
ncbi:unnamed protein product [Rotaria sordida]|uniref:Uncharacterized protein n=2 Tax=Rotaria sordida TaxID=392033 RepID=A0A814YJZ2_9BILA|nr:unnamed protein product [Rotaria sordida]